MRYSWAKVKIRSKNVRPECMLGAYFISPFAVIVPSVDSSSPIIREYDRPSKLTGQRAGQGNFFDKFLGLCLFLANRFS
jgi:hypothetical protein